MTTYMEKLLEEISSELNLIRLNLEEIKEDITEAVDEEEGPVDVPRKE